MKRRPTADLHLTQAVSDDEVKAAVSTQKPKPGKPADNPASYRPISLLSIVYKLLERLILNRITYIVDQQLPPERAGFWINKCTADQVVHLTQDIEDSFQKREKTGVVLVDLTAAFDMVWLKGLGCKLIPDRRDHLQ